MNDVVSELYKIRFFYKEGRRKSLHYEFYETETANLIKQIFLNHPSVSLSVGKVKRQSFFVNRIPFDLKIIDFPANFIEEKRKSYKLKSELTELKQHARRLGIAFQTHKKASDTHYEIMQKLIDRDTEASRMALASIDGVRRRILDETIAKPHELITNLYEKQGEMRFDASNRLFLILVDSKDYNGSWKLRRNLDLLKPTINHYLDNFAGKNVELLKITFNYAGKEYSCLADCVFVTK